MDKNRLKITRCAGEGQGECKRCADNGIWNRKWMCFLYKIEGYEGCYCYDCTKAIEIESRYRVKMDGDKL